MGIYQRDNGIYYYQTKKNGRNIRISLETRNKDLAYRIYENYIMNKLETKLFNINKEITNKFIHKETYRRVEESMNKKDDQDKKIKTISKVFAEYRESCVSQNLSLGVIKSKDRLNELFKEKKIKSLEEINQKFINEIVKKYGKDTANRYIKNVKAF